MSKIDVVKKYIEGWKSGDKEMVLATITEDCVIRESHGPIYQDKITVAQWFDDWSKDGHITKWDILSFLEYKNVVVFEWEFHCMIKKDNHKILGITVAEFKKDKISNLREYKITRKPFVWKK